MTNRKNWPLSLSCAAVSCTEEILRQYQNAGIHYMELTSSGDLNIIRDRVGYTKNGTAAAIYNRAKSFDVTIGTFHLPYGPFDIMDPAALDKDIRKNIVKEQSDLIRAAADSGSVLLLSTPVPNLIQKKSVHKDSIMQSKLLTN